MLRHHPQPARPAVFLDRDGTINRNVGYVNDPARIELLPRAAEAVAAINRMGYLTIMITNQSAVARGLATREQVERVIAEVAQRVAHAGGHFDAVYYCPYHEDHGDETLECFKGWRKPEPGMLLEAAAEMNVDLAASWMVGDGLIDHQAGRAAHPELRTILLPSSYHDGTSDADYHADTLWDAVQLIAAAKVAEATSTGHSRPRTPSI